MDECSFEGCTDKARARALCAGHLNQLYKGQELRPKKRFVHGSTEKHCSKCKDTKPLDSFRKDKSQRSGYESVCKECRQTHLRFAQYGITVEQYDQMLERQGGRCANTACRAQQPGAGKTVWCI